MKMRNGTPDVIVFKVDNKNHKAKLHRFKAAFQGPQKNLMQYLLIYLMFKKMHNQSTFGSSKGKPKKPFKQL